MPVYDAGFKIAARASGRELAEVAGLSCSRWRPIVSEVQVTERFADRAFRATYNGERCVVYFEAYTSWRKKALWNVLAKAGMLSEREKLPALTVLYILRPRGYEDVGGTFRLQVGGRPTQQRWSFPVPLWQQVPTDWWRACPGLMALYPLTQHGQPAAEAVWYAADAIRGTVAEAALQANLLASLGFFGELAYPRLDVFELIGREQMRQSKLYRELVAEERQAGILEALEERFGRELAATVAARVTGIKDLSALSRLHHLAIRCTGLEEFQEQLGRHPNAGSGGNR
jgi:hypothetical protein